MNLMVVETSMAPWVVTSDAMHTKPPMSQARVGTE